METKDVLTKLAIRNANLEIEIATLQAQNDELKQKLADLQNNSKKKQAINMKIIMLGDSITQGWNGSQVTPYTLANTIEAKPATQ